MEGGSNPRVLSHGSNPISDQLFVQWQNSCKEGNATSINQQEELKNSQPQGQCSPGVELMHVQYGSSAESQQQQVSCSKEPSELLMDKKDDQLHRLAESGHLQDSLRCGTSVFENISSFSQEDQMQHAENHQYSKLQKMNNQQVAAAEPANNSVNRNKLIQFGQLLPVILPLIDKDRAMQLRTLYSKLKERDLPKSDFVRLVRNLIGDQMLRQAYKKLQLEQAKAQVARNSQVGPSQFLIDSRLQNSREIDNSDFQRMHMSQTISLSMNTINQEAEQPITQLQRHSNQQQHHAHLPQASFPIYGTTISNYHPREYSGAAFSGATTPVKSQSQDSQMRQVSLHQGMVSTQTGGTTQPMGLTSVPKYEMQNSMDETKRSQSGSLSHLTTHPTLPHAIVPWQSSMNKEQKNCAMSSVPYVKQEPCNQTQEEHKKSQLPVSMGSSCSIVEQDDQMQDLVSSATTPLVTGTNVRMPLKKPSIGQRKPLGMLGVQSSLASKKQKVTGTSLEQSIEQLNDVTAVSGVNLKEEEEHLFSRPKEVNRASEATRRVVQEEEERLILQKNPLQKRLSKIMANCGIKNVCDDVGRCLSLCVEERMRGLIGNLIRLSKHKIDIERHTHRTIIASDVRHQILMINRKAKGYWERKQVEEAEKFRKLNENEENPGADHEKDKDEGRIKTQKVNKEEDDKMRATAANVAARVAIGGDDMLSKWQLMAKQARQKREGGRNVAASSPLGTDANCKPSSTSGRGTRDNQDTEGRGPSVAASAVLGTLTKFGRNQVVVPPAKMARSISVKDLIVALEREPQMSKSALLYSLYERMCNNATAE